MKAGTLSRKVSILRSTTSRNATGEEIPVFAEVYSVFAAVEPLRGRELWASARKLGEEIFRFTIRDAIEISAEDRIALDGMTFGIRSIEPDAGPVALIILGVKL